MSPTVAVARQETRPPEITQWSFEGGSFRNMVARSFSGEGDHSDSHAAFVLTGSRSIAVGTEDFATGLGTQCHPGPDVD